MPQLWLFDPLKIGIPITCLSTESWTGQLNRVHDTSAHCPAGMIWSKQKKK
jgi:hypothetical protein